MASFYYYDQKALKGKTCSRLLKPQKVAPNAKSCSKVAEHNRDRPTCLQRASNMKLPSKPRMLWKKVMTAWPLIPFHFCKVFQGLEPLSSVNEHSISAKFKTGGGAGPFSSFSSSSSFWNFLRVRQPNAMQPKYLNTSYLYFPLNTLIYVNKRLFH